MVHRRTKVPRLRQGRRQDDYGVERPRKPLQKGGHEEEKEGQKDCRATSRKFELAGRRLQDIAGLSQPLHRRTPCFPDVLLDDFNLLRQLDINVTTRRLSILLSYLRLFM